MSILLELTDLCSQLYFILLNPTGVLEKSWQFRTSRDNSSRSVKVYFFSLIGVE